MNLDDIEDLLEHSGVKGMKWGKRKPRDEKARAKQFGPKKTVKTSSDFKATEAYRGRDPRTLSNKQLKALNERMNLENNYKQNYSKLNPTKKKKGEQAAKEILATVGVGVSMYNLVKSPFGQDAINMGKKVVSNTSHKIIKGWVPGVNV